MGRGGKICFRPIVQEQVFYEEFIISFSDSSEELLCKYILEPVYVDSYNVLSFDDIDETYLRKTYAGEHIHTLSDITDYTAPEADLSNYLTKSQLIDLFYPVGSIYTSMNSTNPSNIFGGTWTQITDQFLYCSSSSGNTRGSSNLTTSNLPAHTHKFTGTQAPDTIQNNGFFRVQQDAGESWGSCLSKTDTTTNADLLLNLHTFSYTF